MVDPHQFVITRRRKKYKFALFANSPICFEMDEWNKQPVDVIELGAGTGLFSVELATQYPDTTFLAVDVKADRLQKGARMAEERGLANINFVRARADQLPELVPDSSLDAIWLTFPDPFPKKRSAGRRMTSSRFLGLYARLLKPGGFFHLKHDDADFFAWSLEQLVASKWQIDELTFDLHETGLQEDGKILTTYEARWLQEGLVTKYVRAERP